MPSLQLPRCHPNPSSAPRVGCAPRVVEGDRWRDRGWPRLCPQCLPWGCGAGGMGGPGGALGSFLHMGCCLISWHLVLELQTNHPCALQAGDGSGGGGTWQVWCEGTAWGSDLLSSLSYSALSRAGFYALCCHWMTTGCCLRTRQSLHPARTCRHPPLSPAALQHSAGRGAAPLPSPQPDLGSQLQGPAGSLGPCNQQLPCSIPSIMLCMLTIF